MVLQRLKAWWSWGEPTMLWLQQRFAVVISFLGLSVSKSTIFWIFSYNWLDPSLSMGFYVRMGFILKHVLIGQKVSFFSRIQGRTSKLASKISSERGTFFSRPSPVFRCCKYFFYLIYFPPPTYDVYINIQDCCVGSSFIHIIVCVVFNCSVEGLQFLYSFFLISNISEAVLDSLLMLLMCMLLSTPLTGKVGLRTTLCSWVWYCWTKG